VPFTEIRGQRLHYQDTGGAGPAIVFSHGLLMDASMWDAQVKALRGRHRCITRDERGHGQTGEASEDFTYEASVEDLLGLLHSQRESPANLHAIYRALLAREDFTPRLSEVDVPALVIWGDRDPAISQDHARALAEGLPQGRLEIVAGAGHGVNFTHPDAVNALLEHFLEPVLEGAR